MIEETVERVIPGTPSWDYYGQEHFQRYDYFSSYYKGKSVLDAACGTGYGTRHMLDSGASKGCGVDISGEALDFARTNYRDPNLEYLLFDCSKLSGLTEKFDVVVSFETIEHVADPLNFIEEVSKVLHKGGTFICSTPNKDRLSGAGHINPFHPSELYYSDFKKGIEKYFTVRAEYHQSESVAYFRYMQLKEMIAKSEARSNAFIFNRIERMFRKVIGKSFETEKFMRPDLEALCPGDMEIEPLKNTAAWHKTYIIVATL
jgi:2-polyprenyl-3-methyl-5-hydroxy-6-metoxy-1,4-benzoquinol methylase